MASSSPEPVFSFETPRTPWTWDRALAVLFGWTSILAALVLVGVHVKDQTDWRSYYAGEVRTFADDACRVAVAPWPGSFAAARAAPHELRVHKMPTRGTVDPPRPKDGEYLYVSCTMSLPPEPAQGRPQGWLSLGPVYGPNAVYVNGTRRAETHRNGDVEIALLPEDGARHDLTVELIARKGDKANTGMVTLRPPFVTFDDLAFKTVKRFRTAAYLEQPVFRLALGVAIVLLLLGLSHFGMAYGDVHWLTVFVAARAGYEFLHYAEFALMDETLATRLEGALNMVAAFSLVAFHYHVLNRVRLPRTAAVVTVAMIGAAAVCLMVSEEVFYQWRLYHRAQRWLTLVGLATVFGLSALTLARGSLPPNAMTRVRRYAVLGALAAAAYAVEIVLEDRSATFVSPLTDLALVLAYGGTLVVDLAQRQKLYFAEREARLAQERQLAETQAAAQAAQMIAHDVRRPVNMLKVFAERIIDLAEPRDVIAFRDRFLPEILAGHARVDGLLNDLMDVGRPQTLRWETVPLADAVLGALPALRAMHPEAAVSLRWALGDATVRADGAKLRRVVENIVENALQATAGQTTLTFTAVPDVMPDGSRAYRFGIGNAGSHVPAASRDHIFAFAFTQGKAAGHGLGLALCRLVVEAHGGRIWCDSDPSTGTIFCMLLPQCPEPAATRFLAQNLALPSSWRDIASTVPQPIDATAASSPLRGRLVLVDDDELQHLAWTMVVKDANITGVSRPEDLPDVLVDLAAEGSGGPVVFVVDWHFEGSKETGATVAARLKAWRHDAFVILASHGTPPEADRTLFSAVIPKSPVPFLDLLALGRADSA